MNKLDKIYLIVKSWGRGPPDRSAVTPRPGLGRAGRDTARAQTAPYYRTGDNKIQLITPAKFVMANFREYHYFSIKS